MYSSYRPPHPPMAFYHLPGITNPSPYHTPRSSPIFFSPICKFQNNETPRSPLLFIQSVNPAGCLAPYMFVFFLSLFLSFPPPPPFWEFSGLFFSSSTFLFGKLNNYTWLLFFKKKKKSYRVKSKRGLIYVC